MFALTITPAVSAYNLLPIVEAQIHGATYVMTDEGGAAKKLAPSLRSTVPSITALANAFAATFAPKPLRATLPS